MVMKKFLKLQLSMCLFLNTAALASVQSQWRVGVLDMQRVILSVAEGIDARATLEKEIKAKEAVFMKEKQELDQLNKQWTDQSALLSEESRMQKQKEFQEKFVKLRNSEMAFQNEIKRKETEATKRIAIKASKIAETYAKKKKLNAVFESSSAGLIYVDAPEDLTAMVIDDYNKDYKKGVSKSSSTKSSKKG